MKKKALLAVISMLIVALLLPAGVFAADEIRIFIDGNELITDVPPRIINDRTMVPVRAVSEAIDCIVDWYEPTERVGIYTPYGGDAVLSMTINDPVVTRYRLGFSEGSYFEEVTIESPPVIIDGRTLVPLRIIAETLGFEVDWDENTNTIFMKSREDRTYTKEQARDLLYENHVDAELVPLDGAAFWKDGVLLYCFEYDDIDRTHRVWVNSMTGAVRFDDEMEGYAFFPPINGLRLIQYWLDEHPDMIGFDLENYDFEMFRYNGEDYYRFYYEPMYFLEFLVNTRTGELLCRQFEDGENAAGPIIESLDDYYEKYYGAVG